MVRLNQFNAYLTFHFFFGQIFYMLNSDEYSIWCEAKYIVSKIIYVFHFLHAQVDCSVRIEQSMQQHTSMTQTASPMNDTANGSASLLPRSCQRLRLSSLTAALRSQTHKPVDNRLKRKEEHRIVMMGSAKVGKSSVISQFLYDKYLTRYRQTVEELHRGEYELPDGASLTLDILDTSGAFQFPAMRALSISTSGAFILVYAVDDADTWAEVVRLREQVCNMLFTNNTVQSKISAH